MLAQAANGGILYGISRLYPEYYSVMAIMVGIKREDDFKTKC